MKRQRDITTFQASSILISTIIGVGVLPLPLFAVQAGDTAGPLITIVGIMIAFIGLWIISILGMRFPNQTIIQYSEKIIGKWLGRFCSLLVITFFLLLTGLAAREFGAVVITAILERTPLEITVIVILLMAAISTRNDMNTFAYIHNFYLPIILAPGLIIVVLSLKNANILYLLPILGNEIHLTKMGIGALTVAALFQGAFVMTMIIPFMEKTEKAMKASILAIVISGTLYLLIVTATLAVFGPEELKKLFWPTLELARTTSLPGNILQRLDIVFLSVWVIAVFTTLFSSYKFSVHALSDLFRFKDHKFISFFILPIVFVIAMVPQNTLQMYAVIKVVGKIGLFLTILYPIGLLMVAKIRKLKSEREA